MTTIQMVDPQSVQTVLVNGQLMQVVPANQMTTQQMVVTTGSQQQMMIVQNSSNQQVVQLAPQPTMQAVVQPAPVVVDPSLQPSDLPPSYEVNIEFHIWNLNQL